MIQGIEIKGLFDTFDHQIELKKENITLILGENGLGKTLILKLINAFFCADFNSIYSCHFQEFILTFDNNEFISIKKQDLEESKQGLLLTYWEKNKRLTKKDDFFISIMQFDPRRSRRIMHKTHREIDCYDNMEFDLSRFLPFPIERLGVDRWYDVRKDRVFSTRVLIDLYREYLPVEFLNKIDKDFPQWLREKIDSLNPIFIETQRLLIKNEERNYRSSVVKYSQELVEKIKNQTVIATDLGSKLDKSFPSRVIKQITQKSQITDNEVEEGLILLSKKREVLNKVGLLETSEEEDIQYYNYVSQQKKANSDLLRDVLKVYISDSNEKLVIYDSLAQKLELLLDIINKRFLYKKLIIDRGEGFTFKSTVTNKNIPISGLSSGEQHELVLFYQLLFSTDKKSILLIDEPEISLHISWQNHFIEDLKYVIALNSFPAIIATHSPDIINNNWNLTKQLEGI